MIGKENKHILVKHGDYYIRVHSYSLQVISNNNVDIPEPFENNKNLDDNDKNIDEQLFDKYYSFTSDVKVCFTPVLKSVTLKVDL